MALCMCAFRAWFMKTCFRIHTDTCKIHLPLELRVIYFICIYCFIVYFTYIPNCKTVSVRESFTTIIRIPLILLFQIEIVLRKESVVYILESISQSASTMPWLLPWFGVSFENQFKLTYDQCNLKLWSI